MLWHGFSVSIQSIAASSTCAAIDSGGISYDHDDGLGPGLKVAPKEGQEEVGGWGGTDHLGIRLPGIRTTAPDIDPKRFHPLPLLLPTSSCGQPVETLFKGEASWRSDRLEHLWR
jgi:hypothetical protein